jgi:hypothetical protein
VSTQPISDERLQEIGTIQDDVTYKLQLWQFANDAVAALVAVRAECDRLVTVKEAAEQVIRDYPPHEYGCEWSEYSPSFGALREALAAVSSPGEETP